jgi:transketolase
VLERTISELAASPSHKPKAIVAHTVKGRGVSFMEHDNRWHYTRLTADSYARAMAELTPAEAA